MATYSPTCHPQNYSGLVDIKIAVPYTGTLVALGTATDEIRFTRRKFYHDVHGDRNAGYQGPPIEVQDLGTIYTAHFALSSYNQTAIDLLHTAGVHATNGVVAQGDVGKFILTTRSIRVLFHTTDANKTQNFWCAVAREPIQVGEGSKFSEWHVGFEFHRPPCGHAKADIIWDRNSDAYS